MVDQEITLRPQKNTFIELINAVKINPPAVFSLVIIFIYVFIGLFGSMLAPYEFDEMGVGSPLQKPSWEYLFGNSG